MISGLAIASTSDLLDPRTKAMQSKSCRSVLRFFEGTAPVGEAVGDDLAVGGVVVDDQEPGLVHLLDQYPREGLQRAVRLEQNGREPERGAVRSGPDGGLLHSQSDPGKAGRCR